MTLGQGALRLRPTLTELIAGSSRGSHCPRLGSKSSPEGGLGSTGPSPPLGGCHEGVSVCMPSHGNPSLLGVIVQKGWSLEGRFNQGWLVFSSGTGIPPGLCGDVVKV